MHKAWRTLAYSQATAAAVTGGSLILRPPAGQSSSVLTRLDELTGGYSFVGVLCLAFGLAGLAAVITRRGVRFAFGAMAAVFVFFAVLLTGAAVVTGTGVTGAALSAQLAVADLVVVRAAARAEAAAEAARIDAAAQRSPQ